MNMEEVEIMSKRKPRAKNTTIFVPGLSDPGENPHAFETDYSPMPPDWYEDEVAAQEASDSSSALNEKPSKAKRKMSNPGDNPRVYESDYHPLPPPWMQAQIEAKAKAASKPVPEEKPKSDVTHGLSDPLDNPRAFEADYSIMPFDGYEDAAAENEKDSKPALNEEPQNQDT